MRRATLPAVIAGLIVSLVVMLVPQPVGAAETDNSVQPTLSPVASYVSALQADITVAEVPMDNVVATETFAPHSAKKLDYNPAPPDTPPCFQGSETGLHIIPADRSGPTAAAEQALLYPESLGLGAYAPPVATFEALICTFEPKPAGVVRDGIIVDDEVIHIITLQRACFGIPHDGITPDLLLALSGYRQCPTGTSIKGGRIHMEGVPHLSEDISRLTVEIVFTPTGRVREALQVARCESNFHNWVQNPSSASGIFQCMDHHANGSFRTLGLNYWTDRFDPGYSAEAAVEIGSHDAARGAPFWGQWVCQPW